MRGLVSVSIGRGFEAEIRVDDAPHITERDVSAAWNDGLFRGPFVLADGRSVEIVHRGTWTHGFGPDFRDAMISFDGTELASGSVELHLRTSGWRAHGHHLDPRYNDVVLHVVLMDDGAETRRLDGKILPVLELPPECHELIRPRTDVDWSLVGGDVCAATIARERPAAIREAIWRLGDTRLGAKVARLEARLLSRPPAEVLYAEIWDGLGYSANREPMQELARLLPLNAIESVLAIVAPAERRAAAAGLLFGVAGFLPISPPDANAAGWTPADSAAAEDAWRRFGSAWYGSTLPSTAWTRARVRPANHPALRLAAGASLLAGAAEGLLPAMLTAVRDGVDVPGLLREHAVSNGRTLLGDDRATGIVVNAVIPFALALAEHTGDFALGEAAAKLWEGLPAAESNELTRRAARQVAGDVRISGLGARGQQGLIQLDQTLCRPRRCFECPIAAVVLHKRDVPDLR